MKKKAHKAKKPGKRAAPRMGKKEAKPFKDLLVKAKIDLLSDLNQLTKETLKKTQREASGDLSGYSYHMADMASDVYERDFLLQLAAGERELFLRIEDALKRIEEGAYGVCLGCEKKIAKTRLKAIPHAAYCRDCQEKEEKEEKKK